MEMTDQETLMKAFECCLTDETNCDDCPYCNDSLSECMEKLRNGAIPLLKKQKPASPTWEQGKAYCGECGQRLPRKRADREINYCSYCGQEVTWNG